MRVLASPAGESYDIRRKLELVGEIARLDAAMASVAEKFRASSAEHFIKHDGVAALRKAMGLLARLPAEAELLKLEEEKKTLLTE